MESIENFVNIQYYLTNRSGHGDGSGSGSGSGYGSGYGDGDGNGYGSGNGYESGGIKIFNSHKVYIIDSISTIITFVRNNIAKGFILNSDFTLTSCFIVKKDNYYAHGNTLREAFDSLQEKLYNNYPLEDRILKFKEHFIDFSKKYKASDFFIWHNILTNSCKMGRLSFVNNNNINLKSDMLTVYEFIELTKDSYNGEHIKKLLD